MFCSVTAAIATPLIDVANKTLSPTELNEIVRTSSKVQVPPVWTQDHPWEDRPHPTRVQDECHDTWFGEEIASVTTRY